MLKKERPSLIPVLDAMEDDIYIVNQDFVVEFMNMRMVRDFGDGTGKKCYAVLQNRDTICPWCRAEEVSPEDVPEIVELTLGKNRLIERLAYKDPRSGNPLLQERNRVLQQADLKWSFARKAEGRPKLHNLQCR